MVSQKLLKENPKAVAGLVRAINRALKEVIANPDTGIATLVKVEPLINGEIEKKRIAYALNNLMNAPEAAEIGIGDLKDDRLTRSIDVIAEAYELKSKPARERRVQPLVPAAQGRPSDLAQDQLSPAGRRDCSSGMRRNRRGQAADAQSTR